MFSLAGKTVIVTGGGRGVGVGISRAMAKAGANVVITGRTASYLEDTAAGLRKLGAKALVVAGDITSAELRDRLIKQTLDTFGQLDCLVNNAGSADPNDVGLLLNIDEGQFDRVVGLNLKAAFFMAQAAARAMSKRGGSIVNISSRSGSFPCPNTGHYGAAKAGLESLNATMATEWGHMGIRVNALGLGIVQTEHSSSAKSPSRQKRNIEITPLRRLGVPDDVGPLCAFLASDESSWISGTVIRVDGGGRLPVGLLTYFHQIDKKLTEQAAAAAE
jgi:NAD(P)-dependent dehydrogenase (short-subunit alcohol dehydrogenase family)